MSGNGATLRSTRYPPAFSPGQVSAVAAGYWWDPATVRGSGATIVLPEMNGRSAFDMVTPAANTAPAAATINGQPVLTFANGSPDQLLRTSVVKQRGWTGATMIWGWVSMAAGAGVVLGHWRTAPNLCFQFTASDVRLLANDGSVQEARFPLPAGGYAGGPFYIEGVITPSGAHQIWYNRVQQTPNVSGSLGASLADTAEFLNFAGSVSDSNTGNITANVSCGAFGFTNGIPSTAERDRVYAYRRLA